jgi:hypothetical protein
MFNVFNVPKHVLAAGKIRTASAEKLAKKYDMHICGVGGGMMGRVNEIGIAFMVYRPLKKEEARELVVKCVQEFLEDINNDPEVRPYLVTYPFDERYVRISLYSESPRRKDVCYPYISIITSSQGRVHYLGRSSEKDEKYEWEERETFQEALQILRGRSEVL